MIVVPDASVLLMWVLRTSDEPDTEKALALRQAAITGAVILVVPRLWLYEVGNTLTRRFPAQARSLLEALLDFGPTEARRSPRWLRQTVSLATQHGVTFYDAAYHATALVRGGVFVTADERYVRRAESAGGVVLLRDWNPPPDN